MTIPSDKPQTTLKPKPRQMPESGPGDVVSRETTPLRWVTDRGLAIASGANTLGLYRRLAEARLPGVVELVPADGSLLLVLEQGSNIPPGLHDILNSRAAAEVAIAGRRHEIPVRFDGADLAEVAERVGLTPAAIVDLLVSLSLGVKFLGFQPGFAYLDGLPPELHLPRLATPRKKVPASSVALGGGYCGIYPAAGPGGWHLVGTTDMRLFDPAAVPPARLQPGDSVRLVAA
jgi:KipI family sensor histidine kinase inhibitor